MAGIARGNGYDTVATGHGCDVGTVTEECSLNVFVNGIGACRDGDHIRIHNIQSGTNCVPHSAQILQGSAVVFVNGLPVARIGDRADLGSITSGSTNVFAGTGYVFIIMQDDSFVITEDGFNVIGN